MPKLTANAGGPQVENGVYDGTCLDIEQRAATANSPNRNPFLMWTFHVYDTEEGQEMKQSTSSNFSPRANARQWAEALLGRKIDDGEEIDTDTLCPKDCQVVVKRDEDRGFARIVNVLPPKKRPIATLKKAAAARDGVVMDDNAIPF